MNFKNKLFSKLPFLYISRKEPDKKKAKLIYDGYKAIKSQGLFDKEFYLEKYPDTASIDSLLHYLFFGFDEGKKPSKEFDGIFYINEYDVDINPLIHYALFGKEKGYSPRFTKKDLKDIKDDNKKSILYIFHEKINNVGGTGFTTLDIIKSLDDSYQKFILTSADGEVELWEYDSKFTKVGHWNIVGYDKNQFFNSDLAAIYEEILLKLDINVIHINHLINHSFDIFNLANEFNIDYIMSIHDFYYCCPSIHLVDKDMNYCNLDCCEGCDNQKEDVKIWQQRCFDVLKGAYVNTFPSESTLDIYRKFYPDLDNYKIIEHGRNIEKINVPTSFPEGKIKILFPGFVSKHKGSLLIDSIKKLDDENRLEFHFLGTTFPNLQCGIAHGRYKRDEFGKMVNEIRPNYIGLMSICPETYSHTLTESIATGIPVIVTDLGALKERVEKDNIGWVVNHRNPEEIYNTIINISKSDYLKKVDNIVNVKLKSSDEMVKEYKELYEGLNENNSYNTDI